MKLGSYSTNNLSDLLFNVEKVPFMDFDTNSDYAYSVIGYPNGQKTLLNQCSDVYTLVPNNEIFTPARPILSAKDSSPAQHRRASTVGAPRRPTLCARFQTAR